MQAASGERDGSGGGEGGSPFRVWTVSDRDFALFRDLVSRESGIFLAPVKKALLAGRLAKRLRELGMTSFRTYYERVVEDPAERVRMIDAICTNETRFFREPHHFDFLVERVFPAWREEAAARRRQRRVRVWSAACSSGEEPYSLAMALRASFPPGWELEVLGTDLSTRVLESARRAAWPRERLDEVPARYRPFLARARAPGRDLVEARAELRAMVRLARVNLIGEGWPVGRFDLVFCRNVLMYFDRATKVRVVERLIDRLAPGGYLFLGHAESLGGLTTRARLVVPTVYATGPEAGS